MDIEEIIEFCLKKEAVTDSFPFNETALVLKVGSKMFCLLNLRTPFTMNLKCDPEKAIELREEYDDIVPGFHMNKKHWNTIDLEGNLSNDHIKTLITESYALVIDKMSKKERKFNNLDN